ncbi:MAG: glycosyltransferase family 9 protein [Bacteroidetes bacterium]|nr:glycosyltransferase family 9 protein [Bacteroidota bacterium]
MNLFDVKNLLIIRLSSLGDILLTTPLVRSIKKKYPEIKIDFILKEEYKDLLKFNPYLSNIIEYKTERYEKKIILGQLAKTKYDFVVDLQNNFRSAEIRKIIKTPSVRFNKRTVDKFLLVKFKINRLKNAPQIPVRYAEALDHFKLDEDGLDLFLPSDLKPKLYDEKVLIGFAPGSKHYTKMWPKDFYIELGNKLTNDGFKIVLFGGENDLQTCYDISKKIPNSINQCSNGNILMTAVDLKKCSAIVCNDSGLMHVASALKIPTLAFFGSTVKEFGFTPYKSKSIIYENESLNCRPCTHIGREDCPKKHFNCMLELTPQTALEKLKLLLN